jgi:hypothetical protein
MKTQLYEKGASRLAKTTKKVVIFETFPEIEDLWCLGPGSTSLPVSQRQSFESYA